MNQKSSLSLVLIISLVANAVFMLMLFVKKPAMVNSQGAKYLESTLGNAAVTSYTVNISGTVKSISGPTITVSSGKDTLSFETGKTTLISEIAVTPPTKGIPPPPALAPYSGQGLAAGDKIIASLVIPTNGAAVASVIRKVSNTSAGVSSFGAANGKIPPPPPLPPAKKK